MVYEARNRGIRKSFDPSNDLLGSNTPDILFATMTGTRGRDNKRSHDECFYVSSGEEKRGRRHMEEGLVVTSEWVGST